MSSEEEISIPSEKIKEMEGGKLVVETATSKEIKNDESEKKSRFHIYFFSSEIIIFILSLVGFIFALNVPGLFFSLRSWYNTYAWEVDPLTFVIILPIVTVALLNTYFYIFKLQPKYRIYGFLLRLLLVIMTLSLSFSLIQPSGYSYYDAVAFLFYFIINYAFISQLVLKVYLITTDKSIMTSLFRKAIAGSPSELEWRKYNSFSGYLAIISGVIVLQFFWLFYHILLRNYLIKRAKRKLIVESLEYDSEINLSTISLELGLNLEEVIFILKQLSLKRELIIEFTRYGAILKEIKKPKWFTPNMKVKYDTYLGQQKLSEIELIANKFIELAERIRISEEDFKKVMDIKDEFSVDDLVMLLPHKVVEVKKAMFSRKRWVHFNLEHTLLKRDRIVKAFVENASKIFNVK